MNILADSSFLIDLERRRPPALDWIAAQGTPVFHICATAYGELRTGQADRRSIELLVALMPEAAVDLEVAEIWGGLNRLLTSLGRKVGPNDLWIAATAIRHGMPVVTRDVAEFSRIPGLRVLMY